MRFNTASRFPGPPPPLATCGPAATSGSTFLSVGLDIGTTTTHLILSRLTVGPGDDPFGRHHLLDRQMLYAGRIHRTPLRDPDTIDAAAIRALVDQEYAQAGVRPEDIATGAVIITGETALKTNARAVVAELAGRASSFAASVAGANQEAVLAGRGSGAATWSRRHRAVAVNIDIGGGTTNLAWFDGGRLLDAAAIRVGGRHLLRESSPPGWGVASTTARARFGCAPVDSGTAAGWCRECAGWCLAAVAGGFDGIPPDMVITRPHGPPPPAAIHFLSGGVAELMRRLERHEPLPDLDDSGPILARALIEQIRGRSLPLEYPADPIRATVIGAGQFAMSLSGETVWMDAALLPLTDLRVLHPFADLKSIVSADLAAGLLDRHRRLADLDPADRAAVMLPSLRSAGWRQVEELGKLLAEASDLAGLAEPRVFLMADNYGRLLGESMTAAAPGRGLIVVDELRLDEADYVDIGRPLEAGRSILPVVAKTLVF